MTVQLMLINAIESKIESSAWKPTTMNLFEKFVPQNSDY
jgi:hypothetical protein